MCMTEYLDTKRQAMGPGEQLTIDREWITWLLEVHPCRCAGSADEPASILGYSTGELAAIFNVSVTTIKSWCMRSVFGNPQGLNPNGRDWFVPTSDVEELRSKLREGWWIGAEGLVAPETPIPPADAHRLQPAVPASAARTKRTRVPRRQRSGHGKKGRHTAWREQFAEPAAKRP